MRRVGLDEVIAFFNDLFKRKIVTDAKVGFDPDRTLALDSFTFKAIMQRCNGDIMAGKGLLSEYCDAIYREVTG